MYCVYDLESIPTTPTTEEREEWEQAYVDPVKEYDWISDPCNLTDAEVGRWEADFYTPHKSYKSDSAIRDHREKALLGFCNMVREGRAKADINRRQSYTEFLDKRKWKAGGMQIICAGFGLVVDGELREAQAFVSPSENEVARFSCEYLKKFRTAPTLVGFKSGTGRGRGFDSFQLKALIGRSDFRLPFTISKWGWGDIADATGHAGSLEATAKWFGVKPHSFPFGGEHVQKLWEDREYETIRQYNLEDIRMTGELLLRLLKTCEL